ALAGKFVLETRLRCIEPFVFGRTLHFTNRENTESHEGIKTAELIHDAARTHPPVTGGDTLECQIGIPYQIRTKEWIFDTAGVSNQLLFETGITQIGQIETGLPFLRIRALCLIGADRVATVARHQTRADIKTIIDLGFHAQTETGTKSIAILRRIQYLARVWGHPTPFAVDVIHIEVVALHVARCKKYRLLAHTHVARELDATDPLRQRARQSPALQL